MNVAADRVIRSTVGLRPFRPSGFVVRAEKLDAKTVIHNYGHGGAGITLSWGTAQLAVDLARARARRARMRRHRLRSGGAVHRAAAAGARILAGDLRARDAADDHVEPGGRAVGAGIRVRSAARDAGIPQAIRRGGAHCVPALPIFARATLMACAGCRCTRLSRERAYTPPPAGQPDQRGGDRCIRKPAVLSAAQHPFDVPYVHRRQTMLIEPAIYLGALIRDFHAAGGRIVIREFASARELAALREELIFNCTGLARAHCSATAN